MKKIKPNLDKVQARVEKGLVTCMSKVQLERMMRGNGGLRALNGRGWNIDLEDDIVLIWRGDLTYDQAVRNARASK